MRFTVIVKATESSEPGTLPSEEFLAEMGQFNGDLIPAGVMHPGEGLQASSKGARVKFAAKSGPWSTGRSLRQRSWSPASGRGNAGRCKWRSEWVKRCPNPMPGEEAEIVVR